MLNSRYSFQIIKQNCQQQLLLQLRHCMVATNEPGKLNDLQSQQHFNRKLNGAELFVESIAAEWENAKPFKEIPGPSRLQMIRGFMKGGQFNDLSMMEFTSYCREKYGDVCLIPGPLGRGPLLSIFNPKDFERVHRTEGIYPIRPGGEAAAYYRLQRKDGFFKETQGLMGSGKNWSDFRSKVNPLLLKPQNVRLYLEPLQNVSLEFVQRIRDIRHPVTHEVPENFIDDIQRLILESVAVVTLDKELGLIRRNKNSADAQRLFDSTQVFVTALYEFGVKPSFYRFLPSPTYKRFEEAMDTIFDICSKYIDEALKRIEQGESKQDKVPSGSVLEKLLKIDRKVAIIMAMDMLFGGVDITSSTLSSALLLVAKNPEKQSKLRAEVLAAIGSQKEFTVENMEKLPYLRACIKESLRIFPVLAGNLREAGRDIVLGGYRVPKGTSVLMNSNLLLAEERYFPRPREFIPERWIRGESDRLVAKDLNPFVYQPFGFGPRTCIAKRLVALNLELVLANLVRNFSIEFNQSIDNAFARQTLSFPAIPLTFKFTDL